MTIETVSLDKYGRLIVPANFRKQMGWKPGEKLTLTVTDNEVRVLSRRQALEALCAEVRKRVPRGVSLVEELLRERREEARREMEQMPPSKSAARKVRAGKATRKARG
jgi:AbrB family looped-hinge helix DNA binding protein